MSPEMATQIQTALQTLLVAIAGALTVFIKSWLETKSAKNRAEKTWYEQETRQAKTEFGLKRMDHIVANIVKEAEQKKPTGITPTAEENAQIFQDVKAEIKSQMMPGIVEAVASVVRDPDRYVETKIETAVGSLKSMRPGAA